MASWGHSDSEWGSGDLQWGYSDSQWGGILTHSGGILTHCVRLKSAHSAVWRAKTHQACKTRHMAMCEYNIIL